tara:strand:+ start:280 stop:3036 length:2757 start_codon:yes stop_codon:yes gene_type:complete
MAEIVKGIQQVAQKVVSWFIDIPEIPDTPEVEEIRGTLLNKQSNNAQIPVVYGERLLGGTRVFIETSGTDNTYLYIALVLCEGEINAVTQIQINDDAVTFSGSFADGTEITSNDSKYGTTVKAQPFYGTDGQSASSLLSTLSSWGSNHKLSGICYVAFRFEWDSDKYTGIPNIKVKIQGKKISTFDASSNETTGQYSTNPAFVLLDFMRNERYGKGIPLTELDIPSFYSASQIADTTVTYFTGTTGKLFECHTVLNTNKKILDNVKTLLRGMRGLLPYVQGKYKLIIESTGTASFTLDESNIIGGIKVESERKDQKYNRVLVNFVNPDKNYQADTIVYDTDHATLKTADGGFLQEGNITLNTINSPYQAHEFGKIILQRSRNNLKLGLIANYEALDLAIGDIVNVTSTILGMTNKAFRVSGMTLNSNFTTNLSLQEHQDSWYTFDTITQVATVPDTNLPDPFTIQPPASLTLGDEMIEYNDGSVLTRLSATIGASTDQFVSEYEVEAKQTLDKTGAAVTDDFRVIGRGSALEYFLLNAIDNATYEVRVRAINSIGVKSTFVTATRQIVGQTASPSDVENFSINVVGDQAILGWSSIPDLDLDFYIIRFSTDTTNPTWLNSFDFIERIGRPATSVTVPLKSGSYLIKAQDKLGNQSINETIISTNIESVNFINVQTINEHTGFTGTKSNVSLVTRDSTNFIGLTATGTVGDSATRVPANGTYDFANTIDLGAKLKGLFSASISQITEDVSEFFDGGRPDATTLFDEGRPSPFDGVAPANSHTILEIATSDDNSTFSAFKPFVVGEHIGRYFKFRILFESDDLKARALISNLSVTVSVAKRRESGNDIASGTGGKAVTFTNAFKTTPALGIAAQNMDTGDYFTISSKSSTGFTIEFFNSSDTSINRTFDFIAEGSGQVIT